MIAPDPVLATDVTFIHVEDRTEWRSEVKEFIELQGGIRFQEFISAATVDAVRDRLASISGSVIIVMDLRIEHDDEEDYEGYFWLLEELRAFLEGNASTVVFVISGELNDGIRASLMRAGIPESHIYDKGEWTDNRDVFLGVLLEVLTNMDDIAIQNIAAGSSGKRIDPYLVHSLQASMEQLESNASVDEGEEGSQEVRVPMLIRASHDNWKHDSIPDLEVLAQIGNIYSSLGTYRTIAALERDPDVIAVEASRPGMEPECASSVPFAKADLVHRELNERGDQALIAIVDSGIDVLHEAFLDSNGVTTRILAVWDQTDPTGPAPQGFAIGTEHSQEAINSYIRAGTVPFKLRTGPQDHGTHVASIAAGRETNEFSGGVAPEASIVVVIAANEIDHHRGRAMLGYSASHFMALKYIRGFADQRGQPVVINVSQGMNAGAHDGSSSLEIGFDKITGSGQDRGVVVVKSAGNERNQNGHAKVVMGRNEVVYLKWLSKRPHYINDVIELWFASSDHFRFRLVDPEGNSSEWISRANPTRKGQFASGYEYSVMQKRYTPENGDTLLLIVIRRGSQPLLDIGEWVLEIESSIAVTSGVIHAWIERAQDRPIDFITHVDQEFTLSVPGTAQHVISVGSVNSAIPSRIADYSSFGPTRDGRQKPDVAAPGENIHAASSNTKNDVVCLHGTSMAAPHVAGAIALLFSYREKQRSANKGLEQFNAAQIRAALIQNCQDYDGRWHPGKGYGILDVEAFINELINT